VAIAFIYCDYREPITEDDMLSVIARQLAEQCHSLPVVVKEFRERFLGKIMQPSNDDRISLIKSIVGLFEKTLVFIDALVRILTCLYVVLSHRLGTDNRARTSVPRKTENRFST
jgi:hypothetical protein